MRKRSIVFLCSTIFVVSRFISCAVQGPPTGGPEDTTPPTIIETFPADDATHVARDTGIAITFSESMNRNSAQSALFISPVTQAEPDFSWNKNTLNIRFEEPLRSDKTYIIRIGSSTQDRHRITLQETFSFAFSTGDKIDYGIIGGRVFDNAREAGVKGVKNALIWAYKLEETPNPDPFLLKGEYITETDTEGHFQLTHLSRGTYRIFAMTNEDKDFAFSISSDRMGLPPGDVVLGGDTESNPVTFMPAILDTIPPLLYLVEVPDRNHIRLHFDESVNPHSLSSQNFQILQLLDGNVLPDAVKAYYFTKAAEATVSLYTEALTPDRQYQLTIDNISDVYGNRITNFSDSTTVFTGSALIDTIQFTISGLSPADSSNNIRIYAPVIISFNQPVEIGKLSEHFQLVDSLGNSVSGRFRAVNSSEYWFIPENNLQSLMTYFINLQREALESVEGKILQMNKASFMFTTMDASRTGNLFGEVTQIGDSSRFPVVVSLHSKTGTGGETISRILETTGRFELHGILPGEYVLTAFLDKDNNGTLTPGRLKPFIPAEPFAMYPEEITIRPGIDNVGNNLTIYVH